MKGEIFRYSWLTCLINVGKSFIFGAFGMFFPRLKPKIHSKKLHHSWYLYVDFFVGVKSPSANLGPFQIETNGFGHKESID